MRTAQQVKDRAESSIYVAYFVERLGKNWTTLRDGVRIAAAALNISIDKKRRTDIALQCALILKTKGLHPPDAYVLPWNRCLREFQVRKATRGTYVRNH